MPEPCANIEHKERNDGMIQTTRVQRYLQFRRFQKGVNKIGGAVLRKFCEAKERRTSRIVVGLGKCGRCSGERLLKVATTYDHRRKNREEKNKNWELSV